MTIILLLIPVVLGLGLVGISAFIWSVKSGQYTDLDGDSYRILEDHDKPLSREEAKQSRTLSNMVDDQ